jgi:scyllo-inositol 2-dehydrogenase (NADP+)
MTEQLRTALIGYGLAGRVFHARLVGAEPRMTISHIVTADPGRRQQAATDVPAAALVDDVDELWRRAEEYDVVVVASSNPSHVPLASTALELRKPTVVDKPLAVTAGDADALCRQARALGVPLSVFHNRRWDSDTLAARELIEGGTLGEVVRLESRFTRFRPQVVDRWREDAAAGGGVLLDLGTHLVDQATFLLGPVREVYAEIEVRRRGGRAEDDCFLALRHASGVRSHLWASMAAPVQGPRLLLQGSAAGWSKQDLDGQEDALRTGAAYSEPPGRWYDDAGERALPSPPGRWDRYYAGFAAAVLDGQPVPVAPEDAVAGLRVLEAARTSAIEKATSVLPSEW